MDRMMATPGTILLAFQLVGSILLVFCRTVIATLAIAALQLNDFTHEFLTHLKKAHDRD